MNALPSDIANIISRLSHEMNLIDVKLELIEHATIRNYNGIHCMKYVPKDRIVNQTIIKWVHQNDYNTLSRKIGLVGYITDNIYGSLTLRTTPLSKLALVNCIISSMSSMS